MEMVVQEILTFKQTHKIFSCLLYISIDISDVLQYLYSIIPIFSHIFKYQNSLFIVEYFY